ncbi:type II secretion system F family protein [Candidatus Woesearchaeota archaeon]|nr:type II secretion system F family protein [Candidatus Woesearchaeota archaeon]
MKTRRKSINTNLSFAINHMGAVAASGVPPTKMFKLIAQSTEYGELSIEIEKIVNYVDVFGYDVLTAIKTVAATTPSPAFKEFFEGMISTTQSGGDIKAYLSQKAKEAMLTYKLDRKKYTETISTYSDIYTGILIAAPLFFVAALSLVSLLGGKVGGVDVNIITVVGTYLVIPILNIGFITFLELTQPEV